MLFVIIKQEILFKFQIVQIQLGNLHFSKETGYGNELYDKKRISLFFR